MIDAKAIGRQILRMDLVMLLMTLVLMLMGIFFVYSAGYQHHDLPVHGLYKRQIVWVIVGLCLYFGIAFFDYERIGDLAAWIYLGSILLVVGVLLFEIGRAHV